MSTFPSATHTTDELLGELDEVAGELEAALADLQAPFGNFVQRQYGQIFPLIRAGVVLAAGAGQYDAPLQRRRLIYLGAAIEMLYLAVHVHTQLLPGNNAMRDPDRSLMGSTILAGDFCFSRASSLAVQTDSPAVVEIFAQALKRVCEGHLRQMFHSDAGPYDENRELFLSGAMAALSLSGAGPNEATIVNRIVHVLADVESGAKNREDAATEIEAIDMPTDQQRRWFTVLNMVGKSTAV